MIFGLLATSIVPALSGSATEPPATVLSILPPGENGLVSTADLTAYEVSGQRPSNSVDQLGPYAALVQGAGSVTDASLEQYFEPESLGRPVAPVRVEKPDPAVHVTIYRDGRDVPHIFGASLAAMAFGAGYAAAEDRLFLMDVIRHYGEGRLASFLGPSCAFEQMDHDQLLAAGYDHRQLQAQLDALPHRYGRLGRDVHSMIDAYVRGINRYVAATRTNPRLLPADYAAAVGPPQPWTPIDVVALSSLITTIATGGGFGTIDARLLRYLQGQLGSSAGAAALTAFKEQDDPSAPTTIGQPFPYMSPGPVDPALTAIPDDPGGPLAGTPTATTPGCSLQLPPSDQAVVALLRPGTGASNAVVVGAAHSADGHPIAVFGPELGYYAPEILMEEDLHAPGYAAAGAAFPGASFVVEIGRAATFAWSATTASAQQIDQRVEAICEPHGGAPQRMGVFYRYDGRCLPMIERDFREVAFPKPGGLGVPAVIDHRIFLTRHGIVQGWTTVHGRPVAVVNERSTFGHEADSFVGELRWGERTLTHDAASWIAGAADIVYSFNWLYADAHHIAFVVSGRDPVRAAGVDPNLPSWGTGSAEWRGMVPAAQHPHAIDPPSGWLISWNNKPAPGFSASDDMFGWGPVHRSQLLSVELQRRLAASDGRLTTADVVRVAEDAATEDLSGTATVPAVLGALAPDNKAAALAALLGPWAAAGAHRRKANASDAQYQDAAAVAAWDETYPRVVEALFGPLFAAGGVTAVDGLPYAFDVLPMPFANTPNAEGAHQGDGYYVGWEGYLDKALAELAGQPVAQPFPLAVMRRLCGGGPRACPGALTAAFDAAYDALVTANGGRRDPETWTADTATATESARSGSTVTMPEYDSIVYQAVGIVSPPPQDWQNRPTFQQVVNFR